MFIDKNQKRVNIYAPYIDGDGNYFGDLTNPAVREAVGVKEIPEPAAPADYDEDSYYRNEQDTAPYVVYTQKPADQIKKIKNGKIQAMIDEIEQSTMENRGARELHMRLLEKEAAAEGLTLDQLSQAVPYYKKLVDINNQIIALRNQLIP